MRVMEEPQLGERRADSAGGAARRILNALAEGERSVNEIVHLTGLSQPNVSNHLARLRHRNWVRARRDGQQMRYSLAQLPAEAARSESGHLPAAGLAATDSAPNLPALAADYLAALLRLDEARAGAVVSEAIAAGWNWKQVAAQMMTPALCRIGDLWAEGEVTVAEEHAATAITSRLHERLTAGMAVPSHPTGRVVVAGVAGNQHSLGIRIVADYMTAAGWETHCLGGDVPEVDLLALVARLRPDAVLLGVTMEDQLPALRSAIGSLLEWRRAAPSSLPLVVAGGRWFQASGATTVGSQGVTAPDVLGSDPEALISEMTRRLAEIRARPRR